MTDFGVVTETLRNAQRICCAKNESGKTLLRRERVDVHPAAGPIEANIAIDQRENRVIAAEPDVLPGEKLRSALAHNNVPGHDCFAAKFFHAQPFADAVPAVLDAALSFFVCHEITLSPRSSTSSLSKSSRPG